ncbi:hypothetical protein SBADM41S_01852 [Streptomyces badius]
MPLQLDVGEGLFLPAVAAPPPGEGEGQGGQQDVVDARVEPGGDLAQQCGRGLGSDGDGPGTLPGHGVGLGEGAPADRCVGAGQGAPEVRAVLVEGRASERSWVQRLNDVPTGGGWTGCARGVLRPGRGQVVHQDPPGHAVDDHVVGDQDELACFAAPDGAQHHTVVRVEPCGGVFDALLQRPVALLPARGGLSGLRDVEAPALAAHQPGAEHVVAGEEGGEDGVEGVGGQLRRGVQDDRLHEAVDRVGGLAEPLHDGRSHHGAGRDVGVVHGGRRPPGSPPPPVPRHVLCAEDLACGHIEARLPQGAEQGDRQDAVAAELEEVLVGADVVHAQHRRDGRAPRRSFSVAGARTAPVSVAGSGGRRSRVPVDLAVRGEPGTPAGRRHGWAPCTRPWRPWPMP